MSRLQWPAAVRRRLLNLLTALSLMLCVATAALWVRSYWVADYMRWSNAGRNVCAYSRYGYVLVDDSRTRHGDPPAKLDHEYRTLHPSSTADENSTPALFRFMSANAPGSRATEWRWLGFVHATQSMPGSDRLFVRLPLWPIWAICALFPAARLWGFLRNRGRSRRTRTGLCPRCGYDLRATPGRCPECGTSTGSGE